MENRWTVYCHVHDESGRLYVGLTRLTMMKRWNQHLQNARNKSGKGCHHFWNAIRKYGKDAFSHHILSICHDVNQGNLVEEVWIELFDTRNPEKGFNLARGGAHTPHSIRKNPWNNPEYKVRQLNRLRSPEWKEHMNAPDIKTKMSQASRGRKNKNPWNDSKYKEKNLPILLSRNTNPIVKSSISKKLSGRKLSAEHIANISYAQIGKKLSSEHVAKVAAANIGRHHSPTTLAKISSRITGRKLSPEHIEKLKNRPPNPEAVAMMLKTKALKFIPKDLCKNGHRREGISKTGRIFCKMCRYASKKMTNSKPEVRARLKEYKYSWYLKNLARSDNKRRKTKT